MVLAFPERRNKALRSYRDPKGSKNNTTVANGNGRGFAGPSYHGLTLMGESINNSILKKKDGSCLPEAAAGTCPLAEKL